MEWSLGFVVRASTADQSTFGSVGYKKLDLGVEYVSWHIQKSRTYYILPAC
jgi:hypothetical protein